MKTNKANAAPRYGSKAQVTLFIILGIIILLALGLGIYFATKVIIKPKMPATETAIQEYVQECIKQTAIIALKKIGDNGGYISFENKYREFNLQTEPAEGDGLPISEIELYSIPCWWYMKTPNQCNNCYLTSDNMPLLPEIEEQINEYVANNLNICIKGFAPFTNQYTIKTKQEPIIETQITKDSIRITSEYPIEISKAGQTTKIKDFETEINVKFKDIYDLATEIINLEKEKSVIEERIMHMLSAHMGASYDKLPPISEITHDYYLITWAKEIVKIKIQQTLNSYMPLLRFYGTKNSKEINSKNKYTKGFYNAMQINDLNKKYNLFLDISYNDWPIYFSINPEPLTGTYHKQNFPYDILPPIQTNTYEFYYDLSIPLLFQIRDSNAFGGEGYTLNFAVETNIRDNKNPNNWNIGQGTLGPWDSSKTKQETLIINRTSGKCTETAGKYQCSIDNKKYETITQCTEMCYTEKRISQTKKIFKTEFCSAEQKLSGKIKIIVKSGQEKIETAGISYRCGNYKTCSIGITDENGEAEFQLPICYGGALSVHKPGYKTEKVSLNTEINKAEIINFDLKKEKEFTVSFKKMPITSTETKNGIEASCCDKKQNPISTQKATLSIEKVKENPIDTSFVQAIVIDQDSKIKLVPGKYKVTMQYLDEIGIVIPAECKSVCIEEKQNNAIKACSTACKENTEISKTSCKIIFPLKPEWCEDLDFAKQQCEEHCAKTECKKWMKLPEEDMNIRPALLGGAMIDSENGYWIVTEADINSGLTNINFYVLEVPTPTCLDTTGCAYPPCIGLDEIGKIKEYSDLFRQELEPVFS
ncbi:hypothetical protein JW851_00270 [Candidatus Woesearchaeota archaeon]|nr:hypothetical protein [Candidatus Woesearchaeota archaeon]